MDGFSPVFTADPASNTLVIGSTVNGIQQVYSENNSSRFFRLSLTYDVGNGKSAGTPREFGSEDERRRTR